MILPTTYMGAMLLLLVSMLCWGSWANTQKVVGKWRFELFYYDFSIGLVLCMVVAAFTLGSMNPKDLTFQDNLLIASYHAMGYSFGAGAVFNLANILLVGAIAVAGMAVAFPIAIGLALVIGVVWNFILNPQGNVVLLASGVLLVVAAILFDAVAYSSHLTALRDEAVKAAALQPDPRRRAGIKRKSPVPGIVLSLLSGALMGTFYPMVEMGRQGDSGVSPYGIGVLFGAGVLLSTLLYNPFFMNFPVSGEPIQAKDYFLGTKGQHLWGILGGIIWAIGGLTNFAAASTPASVQVGPAISYALGQGATLVSALWGLLVWHEFKGANQRVKLFLTAMIVLFVTGLAIVSIAPLYVSK
jgi:glucose uptake protein